METAEQNGGSTRASTVDRRRSVTCWRTRVIAVEANDSLETWLTTGRPARSKRDTRAAGRRRSEKGRGPGLEPCPRPAWPGRLGADLHPAGRLFEFGEADRQDPLLHGGLDLVGVDGSGQGRAVEEPPGPPVHQVLALLVADRAGDAQAVLVDLQFDVVPGDPGEFGLDRVEHLGLVDLGVRLPRRGAGSLRGGLVMPPPHAIAQVLELADRVLRQPGTHAPAPGQAALPAGWLGKFGGRATVLVAPCP